MSNGGVAVACMCLIVQPVQNTLSAAVLNRVLEFDVGRRNP